MNKEGSTKIVNFITPGAGVLLLGHISRIVKMHYSFKNLFLYSQAQIRQTQYKAMMTKEGSTKIVNFMTPGAKVLVLGYGHESHIVKIHYFNKNFLLYLGAQIKQTKYIVIMINCKFHKPRDRVSCARVWPYESYSKNALFF